MTMQDMEHHDAPMSPSTVRELAIARVPSRRRTRHDDDSDVDSDDVPSSLPRLLTDCFVKDTEGYWDVQQSKELVTRWIHSMRPDQLANVKQQQQIVVEKLSKLERATGSCEDYEMYEEIILDCGAKHQKLCDEAKEKNEPEPEPDHPLHQELHDVASQLNKYRQFASADPDERPCSERDFRKYKEMVGKDLKLMRNLLETFVEEFFQRDLMLSIQHHVEEECVNWMQERERVKLLEKQSRKRQRANATVDADEKEKRKRYEELKLLRMKQFGMM